MHGRGIRGGKWARTALPGMRQPAYNIAMKRILSAALASILVPVFVFAVDGVPVTAVKGYANGRFPVTLRVTAKAVTGKVNGGYPVSLVIDEGCSVTGTMHGGYPVEAQLAGDVMRGKALGGYPFALKLDGARVSGEVHGGYQVELRMDAGKVTGTADRNFPVNIELSGELDACRLLAALIPVVHAKN